MLVSLFNKKIDGAKLMFKHEDVVIGSRTKKEHAFQIGNFLNMIYNNIEKESKTMTNKVALHNIKVDLDILKMPNNPLYFELVGLFDDFPTNDKEMAYKRINKAVDLISILYSEYYEKL